MSEEFNNGNVTNDQSFNNVPQQGGESKGLAIASMVCGIASIVILCFNGYIAIAAAIVAIVLSVLSKKKIGKNGMATAGLVCGIVSLVIFVICVIIVAVAGVAVAGMAGMM